MMNKALIYSRVSTEEQAKEGYSLDAQQNFCSNFAKHNNYRITGVYRDEGKSATNLKRPALQDLLAKCQQDKSIDAVIVQETDRLARNTQDHLTIKAMLRKADIRLISVAQPMLDESPEGNMIDTILASVNQFQSDLNGRKTKKGMQEKFDKGGWPHLAPPGYLNAEMKNSRKTIIPDPERWLLVKEALKMYLTGNHSATEISEILYRKGLKSKMGKMVGYSTMIEIIKNPFYAGIMRQNKQERMGKHKAMITIDEHKKILNIVDNHNRHACRKRIHNFLLRGFVFCDICNQRYTAEKHRTGKNPDYYHCSARNGKHSNKGQNIEVKELEKKVEEQFKDIQFSDDLIQLIVQKIKKFYENKKSGNNQERKIFLNRKTSIENKREVAEEKLIAGTLSDEDFGRIKKRYEDEIDSVKEELDKIEQKHNIDVDTLREALILSKNIYKAYKKAPCQIKRLYLSFFWDGFWAKDREIISRKPTKLIDKLIEEKKVIIKKKWLRRWDSNPRQAD